ncbi:MAG: fucose isomerase [Proteobacteria bacterium]|nr:fucose isomerase [Pseudomonadota bacterium]
MNNIPDVKLGIVAVSRDCFPIELSKKRKREVIQACNGMNLPITDIETVIENENDTQKALVELKEKSINALIIYLGNFGPEGPLTLLAQNFKGPVMLVAAAEENTGVLLNDRGDAYCGMLNASYNVGLRHLKPHIPEYPIGTPDETAEMISDFLPVARTIIGVTNLKIFSFGPRPQDFLACNAPIKPLYDLGVEVMENSELDLYDIYLEAEGDVEIASVKADMERELGKGNRYPDLLDKLAKYELALTRFHEENLGMSSFGVFANKCWPAFEKYFAFVPCYVNSRLAAKGIPVSCEVDIYGVLSEYMISCAGLKPATLLDINNTVPADLFKAAGDKTGAYRLKDLFMGFHCGNTCSSCLGNCEIKYQKIMHRLLESDKEPDITRGTLEGNLTPGDTTIFRLQSTADTRLKSYIVEGEILDIDPQSFGGIGIFAVEEMGRFYRHVLIEKRFPHHTGVAFHHIGKALYAALRMLGVDDISFNHPTGMLYKTENPFQNKSL